MTNFIFVHVVVVYFILCFVHSRFGFFFFFFVVFAYFINCRIEEF
jgi:hypothetical protein